MTDVLILGLGNDLVADDGFGPAVIDRLKRSPDMAADAELIFAPVAGFALLDLMKGKRAVLIIDSIVTGKSPAGTLHFFCADRAVSSRQLTGSHQISLSTALEFGRQLGYEMPGQIDIIAVEAADVQSVTEHLTPAVEAALTPAVQLIRQWLEIVRIGGKHEPAKAVV